MKLANIRDLRFLKVYRESTVDQNVLNMFNGRPDKWSRRSNHENIILEMSNDGFELTESLFTLGTKIRLVADFRPFNLSFASSTSMPHTYDCLTVGLAVPPDLIFHARSELLAHYCAVIRCLVDWCLIRTVKLT